MRDQLIAQLNTWHEEDEFDKIVDRINEVPTMLIDEELAIHLGRALNNLGRYKEALKWFLKFEEQGKNDPLWHFRVGYAYYYLDQHEDAIRSFEIAHEMDPEDEDTITFLEWSRREAELEATGDTEE